MQRYFIHAEDNVSQDKITIFNQSNVHHIKNVMRMGIEDKIYCVLPNESAYICEIIALSSTAIDLTIVEVDMLTRELPVEVTIIQALPKKDKLELIVQKGTELGANKFLIFPGDRSVAKWDEKKKTNKLKRLTKIVEEASEQSHRTVIPTLQFEKLSEVINQVNDYDLKLFAYEAEAKQSQYHKLSGALTQKNDIKQICFVIGPEGGFSESEVNLLFENGFSSVRLGRRILRTETAALYALSAISYEFEEKV